MAAFVEGATLGSFGFSLHKDGPSDRPVGRIALALTAERRGPLRPAASGPSPPPAPSWQARLLASVPSNIKTPAVAGRAGRRPPPRPPGSRPPCSTRSSSPSAASAASSASARAPRPRRGSCRSTTSPPKGARKAKHVVLVGKGITFDSGGLSIKPGQSMVTMKRDMTGAAVVAAVMAALPDVDCPVRVTGLLPIAENAVSGTSMRPGDVITQYGGRTTEVTNTDAEGRLVLADGLAYAVDKLDPDVLVDIATLTGGDQGGARPAHRRPVRQRRRPRRPASTSPARASGEPLWRMPLSDEYESQALLQGRRRRQRARGAAGASPPRCSSSTSPAACRGPTSTSPRWATPRRTTSSGPRARPASAPGCCSTGSAGPSRWQECEA